MELRPFQPLSDYALLGDCHGAFLLCRDGSVDWACVPRFDDPPVFARLLDRSRGGFWQIAPKEGRATSTMRYLEGAVVETVHEIGTGSARVLDAVLPANGSSPRTYVRICEGLAGEIELVGELDAREGLGGPSLEREELGPEGVILSGDGLRLRLLSTLPETRPAMAITLEPGRREAFLLGWGEELSRPGDAEQLLEGASSWWRSWCGGIAYEGPYRAAVERSSILLKLLTHDPTGAVVAAPTASLPERVGGSANWDYRYTWLRDASLTLYAWYATGQRAEGDAFFDWICARVGHSDVEHDGLKIMFDVDGGSDHAEHEVPEVEGYRGSAPVRLGNDACTQVQLDVYGEVLEVFGTASAWGRKDKLALWANYRALADWVCEHWHEPDAGIWERRGEHRHYVYSKVMAWVALDRACAAATRWRLDADVARWRRSRAEIAAAVWERGWSERLGAFRQAFETDEVDASNLLLPLVGFVPPDDPRSLANLQRIRSTLAVDGLVYRTEPTDEEEGAFAVCSFWLVNALVQVGEREAAAELFERMLGRASPLGLFSEEIAPGTGEHLGNLPQTFVHAAAVSAAVNLARGAAIGSAPAAEGAPANAAHLVRPLPAVEDLTRS